MIFLLGEAQVKPLPNFPIRILIHTLLQHNLLNILFPLLNRIKQFPILLIHIGKKLLNILSTKTRIITLIRHQHLQRIRNNKILPTTLLLPRLPRNKYLPVDHPPESNQQHDDGFDEGVLLDLGFGVGLPVVDFHDFV